MKISTVGLSCVLLASLAWAGMQTSQSSAQSKNSQSSASASSSAHSSKSSGAWANGSSTGMRLPKPTHAIFFEESQRFSAQAYDSVLPRRESYFKKLQQEGRLLYFGEWRDVPGQMSIVVARTDEEANAIAANDPAVQAGWLTFELRAWTVRVEPFSAANLTSARKE